MFHFLDMYLPFMSFVFFWPRSYGRILLLAPTQVHRPYRTAGTRLLFGESVSQVNTNTFALSIDAFNVRIGIKTKSLPLYPPSFKTILIANFNHSSISISVYVITHGFM